MSKNKHTSIKNQIRDNAIAIISLVVAVVSLSYNSWRNELTEDNRNQRFAAFEIILKLNELQQVVFYSYYEQDVEHKGNPRLGWTYVLTIKDLSMVLPKSVGQTAAELANTWNQHWETLHNSAQSREAVEAGMDQMRADILHLLSGLQ